MVLRFIEDNSLAMRRKDGTFEEDIECIVEPSGGRGGLFISNLEAASNPATLAKHGIGAVISAVRGNNLAQTIPPHIEYLYLPAVDSESFDIAQYFPAAIDLLAAELPRTNALVHCMAGVSRSATLVIAYLMHAHSLSFPQAYRHVKAKRKIISPNAAFLQQLQRYEQQLAQHRQRAPEHTRSPSTNHRQDHSNHRQGHKADNAHKPNLDSSTAATWYSPERPPEPSHPDQAAKWSPAEEAAYDRQLAGRIRVLLGRR